MSACGFGETPNSKLQTPKNLQAPNSKADEDSWLLHTYGSWTARKKVGVEAITLVITVLPVIFVTNPALSQLEMGRLTLVVDRIWNVAAGWPQRVKVNCPLALTRFTSAGPSIRRALSRSQYPP